jgi:hypothetical protein
MTKKRSSKSRLTRRQHAQLRKDERIQRILMWSAIGVGVLIVLIIGYGVVTEMVIKPNLAVAIVDEKEITAAEYQSRVSYERLLVRNQIFQYQSYLAQIDTSDPQMEAFAQQIQQTQAQMESQLSPELATLFGKDILDRMIEEVLVRQKAEEEGLTVEEASVERQIEQLMGYDRDAALEASTSPTMTITETQSIMTEADYQQTYTNFKNNILQEIGFSEEDFRETVEADLLRTKVQDVVTQDISQEAEQVEVTYIASPTEEEALVLQERILAGESIEDLIEILNSNETEQSFGRTLPWYPQRYLSNLLGPELAELAFELSIGEISEPLPGQGGELTYLIYVNGREVRPLDEALLQQEKQEAFNTWLQNQKDERVEYLDWESVTPDEP